jgi:uncharacterized protein (DUF952 family)
MRIFHIVDPEEWTKAVEHGAYVPAAFAADGFVHFSFADQVVRVANALYRDASDLVVVEIDPDGLDLVIEDCYEAGEEFPHVYQPVPTGAAVAVHPLTRGSDGAWHFAVIDDEGGPASRGR